MLLYFFSFFVEKSKTKNVLGTAVIFLWTTLCAFLGAHHLPKECGNVHVFLNSVGL